ncbi:MAG: cobalamin-dependent protein [Myxococcales bacterium]|nr:cobalamin-dependent protein [Myxococcales bacterium]USN51763.1 MAG: cobalamin B12-binding domain-containing protein [Myxococcales bacterium]
MQLVHKVRFVTAASLFDGHDAAIHVMRRILQSQGAEVIHLGHNRSVWSVIKAAIEEDVQGIAVSSYQGGHVEYFSYMLELLKKNDAADISIFGGGGGVIVPEEITLLCERGIKKIYSPQDGLNMGLVGMIQDMLGQCDRYASYPVSTLTLDKPSRREIARTISTLELGSDEKNPEYHTAKNELLKAIKGIGAARKKAPVIGIAGVGGAGKSSLIDEILARFLQAFPQKKIAVLSVDPTKIKSGGALLGDRIRFNSADNDRVFVRSIATREANISIARSAKDIVSYLKELDFDLVLLESAGIGQSDSSINEVSDASIYVMTPEYGAQSQLEKIDMLDSARLVVINKFDRPGSLDALRDVKKTFQRNHNLFDKNWQDMPVFGTSAHIFGDLGTNRFFNRFIKLLQEIDPNNEWQCESLSEGEPASRSLIPKKRSRYLSQLSECVREHHQKVDKQAQLYDRIENLQAVALEIHNDAALKELTQKIDELKNNVDIEMDEQVDNFFKKQKDYQNNRVSYQVRENKIDIDNNFESLSHLSMPKVQTPHIKRKSDAAYFVGKENLPGYFPYTAGVFPFKRVDEDPTRMFAGEGSPERTNKRFHYLSQGHGATRLSTAFDSVTLYGHDPDVRPDIYGKIGNAGVSVCSLDDAKRLYSGFDLIDPKTSVSMTINGPAPTMLAFFFNAAIDFEVESQLRKQGRWDASKKAIDDWFLKKNISQPRYRQQSLPKGHNGNGLGFLGLPSSLIVDEQFYQNVKDHVLKNVRGTIQADILKEEQAQNTCIYSVDFSLRMMGDCQEYFIKNQIKNFYSVSVSGYHIAEAGAHPITQLAFTLANGFTLLEYYRARGMKVDDFAHNFSFFFSNGMDPEYAVIGRVARRIWAIALKNIYGANERSQKLKYHIQTSGRSLHAQEMAFNDIRTTLQAFYAISDHCNSLHTNAFDEAITTPTEESVRRAVAIQMIINHELGMTKNENPLQGSYFIEDLTNKVEEAVLGVFEQLDARGGVLGAMETMYQRSKIQEESLEYEHKKHSGELKIIGVNTFLPKSQEKQEKIELMRSSKEEKELQVEQVRRMHSCFSVERKDALNKLKHAVLHQENSFPCLMEAAKYATIGEISQSFFEVGGAYRRAM